MATKTKKTRKTTTGKKQTGANIITIPGLTGVRLVRKQKVSLLERRSALGMPQEVFARIVNVSVRTIDQGDRGQT